MATIGESPVRVDEISKDRGCASLREDINRAVKEAASPLDSAIQNVLSSLADSFDEKCRRTRFKVRLYKVAGWIILTSIPLLSSFIAFIVGASTAATVPPKHWFQESGLLTYLSLASAFIAVLNGTLRPYSRFKLSCEIGVRLFHWRSEFLLALAESLAEQDATKRRDRTLKALRNYLTSFRALEVDDISLGLPEDKIVESSTPNQNLTATPDQNLTAAEPPNGSTRRPKGQSPTKHAVDPRPH